MSTNLYHVILMSPQNYESHNSTQKYIIKVEKITFQRNFFVYDCTKFYRKFYIVYLQASAKKNIGPIAATPGGGGTYMSRKQKCYRRSTQPLVIGLGVKTI